VFDFVFEMAQPGTANVPSNVPDPDPIALRKSHSETKAVSPTGGKPKVALITGITGQDGSYLAELLLSKNYIVHGMIRRSSSFNTGRLEHLYEDKHSNRAKLVLHYGDLTDSTNLIDILRKVEPDELYNLAAQSHVKVSFELSEYTANVDGLGTLRLLDAIRTAGLAQKTRFYQVRISHMTSIAAHMEMLIDILYVHQASSSELYGKVRETPQTEATPFYPRSPYGKYLHACLLIV